jgi:TonB family protein
MLALLAPDAALAHCGCRHYHRHHARFIEHRHHWVERARVLRTVGAYRDCDNYPRSALEDGATGVTLLKIRVGEDGWVQASSVRRSSGRRDLDRAAQACVADWHFPDAATTDWRTVRVAWRIHWG